MAKQINYFTKNDVIKESEQILSHEYLYVKKIFLKHALFSGGMSETIHREVLHRGVGIGVLAYDPVKDKIILLEQFRIGAYLTTGEHSPWMLEIIAGMVEPNESFEAVARREAFEEAGLRLTNLEKIYQYWTSPGSSSEEFILYYAEVDSTGVEGIYGLPEEGEDILVKAYSFEEVSRWLAEGKIANAHAIIAIQWLQKKRAELKKLKSDR